MHFTFARGCDDTTIMENQLHVEADLIRRLIRDGRHPEALSRARALADSGASDGNLLLGWMFQSGCGGPQDLQEAERRYLHAAKSGSKQAMYYLGSLYGMTADYARAIEWFERSAKSGSAAAMYHLGRMYLAGQGVTANRQLAIEYFEAAATRGHLFAQRNILHEMIKGRRGVLSIPVGIFKLFHLSFVLFRTGLKDSESEEILRL
jgi:TPR repeat protein